MAGDVGSPQKKIGVPLILLGAAAAIVLVVGSLYLGGVFDFLNPPATPTFAGHGLNTVVALTMQALVSPSPVSNGATSAGGTLLPPTMAQLPTAAPLLQQVQSPIPTPLVRPMATVPLAPLVTSAPPIHPEGATGLCMDGTYTDAKHKLHACANHGGVNIWWGP